MPHDPFLHDRTDFSELIRIVADKKGILPGLVEKDYWIMHCLYGLQQMKLNFELKGGTSLSKGYRIIHRFSEDIDIHIEPPAGIDVKTGRNHMKEAHCESRKDFYDWLATEISINGIASVERDTDFDDYKYRSGGIRLHYKSATDKVTGLKEGILLEVGFDTATPNDQVDISSWAYDHAVDAGVPLIDNRASAVACYHPGYTLVEKLQTISTKYRQQRESGVFPKNFMRHYYDVYCLLQHSDVQAFIGTTEYQDHKEARFRSGDNLVIADNEAFLLPDEAVRAEYRKAYEETGSLYYQGQPEFKEIMVRIKKNVDRL